MANSMRKRIEAWVADTKDWFNYDKLDRALNIVTPKDKTLRRVVIYHMVEELLLIKHEYRRNTYRRCYDRIIRSKH